MDFNQLIERILQWAASEKGVEAACLVGSHARGQARPDSDVDLVILSSNPQALLVDQRWPLNFGEIHRSEVEDWGALKSIRIFYKDGAEVEFGIVSPSWAAVPLDPGTRKVVQDGMKILYDPQDILKNCINNLDR